MLVIPVQTRDYFKKVEKEITDNSYYERDSLINKFHRALSSCHLYGCDWIDQGRARFTLYQDFAKWSFGFVIEFRDKDDPSEYKFFCNGGLIFHESDQNWSTHT